MESSITRRTLLCAPLALSPLAPRFRRGTRGIAWTDVAGWPVEGRAFSERAAPFDRLPARAEGVVRKPVWDLSRHASGMSIRFETNAPELRVRCLLGDPSLAMPHMPATGKSGVDLYGWKDGRWRFIAVSKPARPDYEALLFAGAGREQRTFALYLPLYNSVRRLELGVPEGSILRPLPRRSSPLVFYGTSILQGASAPRPGLAWPALVGRALDRPIVNLGFSGNGRMEAALAGLMGDIDARAYVVDCPPNMAPGEVSERAEPFVRLLREKRPDAPILLIEDRTFANAWFALGRARGHEERRRALRRAFESLQREGVSGLHLLGGADLLGDDDATADGSHPNALGMRRQADRVAEELLRILPDGR
ncbi:MAG: SGNH/GDSL hydrolase family protein [Planctomycetota bacterium]